MTARYGWQPVTGVGAALLALLVTGCGSTAQPRSASAGAPTGIGVADPIAVVASTDVYGSIVARIGGPEVAVTSIISDDGADPLEYEATPADAAAVARAQLVVYNGNGYDDFMPQLVGSAGDIDRIIDVAALSGLRPAAEAVGAGAEFNEHMWYSLDTVKKLASTVAVDLSEARPDAARTFTDNAAAFTGQVQAIQVKLAEVARSGKRSPVAATEPLANYLLADAQLSNVAPTAFQEAIEEGNDPPAAVLQDMLEVFDRRQAELLVLNTQTQSAATDQVVQAAERAGVPVVKMSETLIGDDYVAWMGGQVDTLIAALRG